MDNQKRFLINDLLLDSYAAGFSILGTVLCETIAISWIYGIKRFKSDLREMLGFEIGRWWPFCWVFVAPLFLMTIIIYGLINNEPISYQNYVSWTTTTLSDSNCLRAKVFCTVKSTANNLLIKTNFS